MAQTKVRAFKRSMGWIRVQFGVDRYLRLTRDVVLYRSTYSIANSWC
jgi:hypothetical protein